MNVTLKLTQAIGRTLTGVFKEDDRVVLQFDTDEHCYLVVQRHYNHSHVVEVEMDPYSFDHQDIAVEAGLITEEEIDAAKEDRMAVDRGIADVRERNLYDRLKRKYGDD